MFKKILLAISMTSVFTTTFASSGKNLKHELSVESVSIEGREIIIKYHPFTAEHCYEKADAKVKLDYYIKSYPRKLAGNYLGHGILATRLVYTTGPLKEGRCEVIHVGTFAQKIRLQRFEGTPVRTLIKGSSISLKDKEILSKTIKKGQWKIELPSVRTTDSLSW